MEPLGRGQYGEELRAAVSKPQFLPHYQEKLIPHGPQNMYVFVYLSCTSKCNNVLCIHENVQIYIVK